ncbi:hypothetical protein ACCO45_000540 [Purpureocillium lilacinum]|uniref:Uncharacterized protein n=1 Tax=Purpureocillium lilacinum TaxID=33203 RepID=A0ACC4E7B9_PURLI
MNAVPEAAAQSNAVSIPIHCGSPRQATTLPQLPKVASKVVRAAQIPTVWCLIITWRPQIHESRCSPVTRRCDDIEADPWTRSWHDHSANGRAPSPLRARAGKHRSVSYRPRRPAPCSEYDGGMRRYACVSPPLAHDAPHDDD